MYLNALGQPMVIINNFKAASKLLERHANIYSDCTRLIVANEILCGGLMSALMPCGDLLVFTLPLKLQAQPKMCLTGSNYVESCRIFDTV
jgi:hypothetical protein